ncbi:Uu.00g127630.m01.CDS01 [Anthostomella pinea]|uniref:Uu.00g127630.m01.CDS01 n=1 Tax=Anthostomella pinea TaxID=933095 RepID=A0AAI8YHW6_9PEZI|nr:Uu.00g127630.m01.CDS01 [Anthostomella pinea]
MDVLNSILTHPHGTAFILLQAVLAVALVTSWARCSLRGLKAIIICINIALFAYLAHAISAVYAVMPRPAPPFVLFSLRHGMEAYVSIHALRHGGLWGFVIRAAVLAAIHKAARILYVGRGLMELWFPFIAALAFAALRAAADFKNVDRWVL